MNTIKIGLIGLGVVGGGVVEVLLRQKDFFKHAFGIDLDLAAIAEKDKSKWAMVPKGPKMVDDYQQILSDPEIRIVIELIGGVGIAKKAVMGAIAAGKHVVTANKHLIAACGQEIFPEADRRGMSVYFEASVGGGMPVIKALRESLVANDLHKVQCIINGTTNYILTRIRQEKQPFETILAEAQQKGFAEADPALDVDGIDASHKVAIMASLAHGCWIDHKDVYVEGIRHITPEDVAYAEDLGYVIKLLGIIGVKGDRIDVRVHPAMLPEDHLLANVNGVYNGVVLRGDAVGSILLTGKGAGRYPTASAVVSDIIDICRNIQSNAQTRIPMSFYGPQNRRRTVPISEIESRYYLRFTVIDVPGVLGRLTTALGEQQVSIASVVQKERAPRDNVPIVILTHHAREQFVRDAVARIEKTEIVRAPTQLIRIEEEEE